MGIDSNMSLQQMHAVFFYVQELCNVLALKAAAATTAATATPAPPPKLPPPQQLQL